MPLTEPTNSWSEIDDHWMQRALACARAAEEQGEVPIGAVLVKQNQLIAENFNQPIKQCDPSAHAEILTLRAAGAVLNNYRLINTTLYVTLEPCAMCVGAIAHARLARVVYATHDPKSGAVHSAMALASNAHLNHFPTYESGCCQEEASQLLREFFRARR